MAFGVAAAVPISIRYAAGHASARSLRTDRPWQVFNAILGVLLIASILPM
ncbi:MAG: hypothetical protein ACRYFY_21200 [Janthinobacterium lividum]